MGKIEFLESKILENNNIIDLELCFEQIEKLEFDIKEKFNEKTESTEDENDYEVQQLLVNNDFLNLNEGYENYNLKIKKLELIELVNLYKMELEKLFILITDSFGKLKYRCDSDLSKFFKLKIDKLITDIDYINKDTIGKKMNSNDLNMYYNNPYTLLFNSLVYHKDILQVYYNNLFSFDLDILEQSKIIANNGLHLSFTEIENLKKWEDSIEYIEFNISDLVKPKIDKTIYTISSLIKKD